ncbi:unnamed protein product [Kuraishia capsulata CBS 1993]|uniref:Mediator of RNA polymerase II transcription subunit 4 n=1 Tax=Kuraishia capsulata CBS 1993 TaxID=1382522 RepID=W6MNF9_9ASCO|nr:uncharacterized protein KUCA_T00002539001 [Kuraishia capsulata CBS 1993]CDK26567.1 unnamed protein product [Kuraishia capsulata CBS 1993]
MSAPLLPSTTTVGSSARYSNQNEIEIFQNISVFEKDLAGLVSSISRFQPSSEFATKLVLDTDKIQEELVQLQYIHDLRVNQLQNQTSVDKSLDDSLKSILKELNQCRKSLVSLPRLPQEESEKHENSMDEDFKEEPPNPEESLKATAQLLDYAMKLSKFSKIPRTVEGFLHPNNCIWPADGNMRRGMLAMASILGDKLTRIGDEADEDQNQDLAEPEEGVNEKDQDDDSDMDESMPYAAYERDEQQQKTAAHVVSGLDLFDSDEE